MQWKAAVSYFPEAKESQSAAITSTNMTQNVNGTATASNPASFLGPG